MFVVETLRWTSEIMSCSTKDGGLFIVLCLYFQFSDYFTGYFNGQYWLWWIFLLLGEYSADAANPNGEESIGKWFNEKHPPSAGLLLFFRGFVNYLKVRNMSENMATSHRTRLFFLY